MMAPGSKPDPTIPDKLYFRIGEVSRIAGVPASVLRFWESAFRRIKPQRTKAGQRLYRKSDVELILTIKNLLYE
ncbi:MAG: MerR family transcriptional regulator, partial [Desulfosarcinaceae bacterium]